MNWLPTKLSKLIALGSAPAASIPLPHGPGQRSAEQESAIENAPSVALRRIHGTYVVTSFSRGTHTTDDLLLVHHDSRVTNLRWLYHLLKATPLSHSQALRDDLQLRLDAVSCLLPPLSEQARVAALLDNAERLSVLRHRADARVMRLTTAMFDHLLGDPESNPNHWPLLRGSALFERVLDPAGFDPEIEAAPGLRALSKKRARVAQPGNFQGQRPLAPARQAGDILLATRGPSVGTCTVFSEAIAVPLFEAYLICTPTAETNSIWFAAAWNHPAIQRRVSVVTARSATSEFAQGALDSFHLPVPPREIQDRFADQATALSSLKTLLWRAARKLRTTNEELKRQAFSGQLTARWRDAKSTELREELGHQARALNELNFETWRTGP